MSSTPASGGTTIFGIRLNLDPKILVGALIALAALLYWYNSSGDETGGSSSGVQRPAGNAAPAANRPRTANRLRGQNERGTLRLRPVEGGRGDIDPTLRLGLLDKVRAVRPETGSRNLFEDGPVAAQNLPGIPKMAPMMPKAVGPTPTAMPSTNLNLAVHIPFKYYGFARPAEKGDANRGFFMEGDNIFVAAEGDVLERRYLVVALSPNIAKIEDTQLKQGQDLPVTPEAPTR